MPEKKVILELQDMCVGYSEPIVRNVSLKVEENTIWSLIGGNGAGKSTLLKSLFGLTRCFSGTLLLDGAPIQNLSPAERVRKGMGIVPQGRCNFPLMSVRENLEMGAYTLSHSEAKRAMERVLQMFPVLRQKLGESAGNLSGGEQQILETAMALETGPRVLLLDEPSLGLSPKMQQEVFENVESLRGEGLTVIMAEQNILGSLMISDRAFVLDLGTKLMEGAAREVLEDPKIKVAFLGADPEEAVE
ncbi:ABC transporter ATP-binding protein [Manganibacter manganicus]|jgi:branched-chain amino acid transport system ATP-binding protein|uniref:ABC transporter ATP-binding protein n=1 Tax=Manganibacter manganicus TaxID=1873176 RepID=A0A1V8RLQ7_9HYPH|nr:ABC transporter ATP-binding protein [Pseudaminobacter manganicus]OQM74084.1 ABC transporter ATP-binding protein [Pseudaminobacter manganicus]